MNALPRHLHVAALLIGTSWLAACGGVAGAASPGDQAGAIAPIAVSAPAPGNDASPATLPLVRVHKSASCGCCSVWVDHIRSAGFPVEVHDNEQMFEVKTRLGVPEPMMSCHTAEVGGYFIEGHVPADDIKRLLAEKPDARGLAVPGMPIGSPGMESPDGRRQPYTVALIDASGSAQAFSHHE